ncbi:hypothetical protein BC939DRAFT_235913 [Gamsiella multidivaricata]|uniref:uncharacterized protein n=1 Tax=Gamsiella multidivaricata TaxID=101098 RepID=UPI00221E387E|nr:uncharacterized protein BC939DRAFT_235913 [Gamsiella multidivaricata]KAI7820242.1 hypothetical protein BC939DRAFT_235913 [Gamsiella multidivaricata]
MRMALLAVAFCFYGDTRWQVFSFLLQPCFSLIGKPGSLVSEWKLHLQVEKRKHRKNVAITMEIRKSRAGSLVLNPGYLELYFMELRASLSEDFGAGDGFGADSPLSVHRPFVWSTDLRHEHNLLDDEPEEGPIRFLHHAVSGDGNYIATLSSTDKRVILDLWDVTATKAFIGTSSSGAEEERQSDQGSIRPRHCATTAFSMERTSKDFGWTAMVSVSWDGTQVALTDVSKVNPLGEQFWHAPSQFAVYNYSAECRPSSRPLDLQPSCNLQYCASLKEMFAFGRFHIPTTENQNVQDEIFVACDCLSVLVYRAFGKWIQLLTIPLYGPTRNRDFDTEYQSKMLLQSLRGRYFTRVGGDVGFASVWDIKDGLQVSLVSAFTQDREPSHGENVQISGVSLSSDSSIMAIAVHGYITIHQTSTGDLLRYWLAPVEYANITNLQFVCGDTQILVHYDGIYRERGQARLAYILDATTFSVIGVFSGSELCTYVSQPHSGCNSYFYTTHGSLFELIQLQDHAITSYPQSRVSYSNRCQDNSSRFKNQSKEITASSGLYFKVEIRSGLSGQGESVAVVVRDKNGMLRNVVIIPSAEVGEGGTWMLDVDFLDGGSRLLIVGLLSIMVWSLPTTLGGDFNLLLLWSQPPLILGMYTHLPLDDILRLSDTQQAFCQGRIAEFEDGVNQLILMFRTADEFLQQAILRYLSSYINTYPDPDNLSKSIMGYLIKQWSGKDRAAIEQLTCALINCRFNQWIPVRKTIQQFNPVKILVQKARKAPQAMVLAKIFIYYCIAQARTAQDTLYLIPIMDCFGALVDLRHRHSDLALLILRRLAFVPFKSRSFILSHHVIAHPPEFRWRFWRPVSRSLLDCKNPILQQSSTSRHIPEYDEFTQNLFVAPFEFLWSMKEGSPSGTAPKAQQARGEPIFWVRALAYMMLSKFKLRSTETVKCHDFSLEMLDQPMIAALVEYKW